MVSNSNLNSIKNASEIATVALTAFSYAEETLVVLLQNANGETEEVMLRPISFPFFKFFASSCISKSKLLVLASKKLV